VSAKKIVLSEEAHQAVRRGVRTLARTVKVTLGPRGRAVLIEKKWGPPIVSVDGVTVAKEIQLEDPLENVGAQMVREVASKTNDDAGDGTTTATVLAEAIYEEGIRNVASGANPIAVKRGIDRASQAVIAELKRLSRPVKDAQDIRRVGTIAAGGNQEIGEILAAAHEKVGKDGVITVEEGHGMKTELEWVEGLQFDKGYLSPYFVTDAEPMKAILEDPYILIHEKKLSSIHAFIPLLEKIGNAGKPLLVIAEDVEGDVLATLVVNRLRGNLNVCAVKAPAYGDRRKAMMEDIAVLTGGTAILEDLGTPLEKVELPLLGRAKKVIVEKEATTIIEGAGDTKTIQGRIAQIRKEIKDSSSEYDREQLRERMAKLAGGIVQVNVCAATEIEMKEKKLRVEDAMFATRAAIDEGIVPGGGVALVRAAAVLQKLTTDETDEKTGIAIVQKALEAPIRQIAVNSGYDGAVVVDKVKASKDVGFGFNADTGEYGDLFEMGILDPTKVVRCALQNATSVASLLLTTECVIVEEPEKKSAPKEFEAA
jgi:chaperonin GroEL